MQSRDKFEGLYLALKNEAKGGILSMYNICSLYSRPESMQASTECQDDCGICAESKTN